MAVRGRMRIKEFKSDLYRYTLVAFVLLSVCSVLSGCAVGPDFSPPKAPVPQAFGPVASNPDYSSEAINTSWWQTFGDEQLMKLLESVVLQNQQLRVALSRVNEARALRRHTTFDLFPTVTVDGGFTRILQSETRAPTLDRSSREGQLTSGAVDAFWELDLFGRVRRQLEASQAGEDTAVATFADLLRIIIAETALNYFELRGLQEQLAVARSNANNQQETVRITEVLVQGGQATELDISRARALQKNTLASIPPLETTVSATIHRLSVLAGKAPQELSAELQLAKPLPVYSGPVTIGTPVEILRRRPDIIAAERNLAAATAGIGIAVGDYFPKVTFVGSLGVEAKTFSELDSAGAETHTFGPRISWAALDLGRVHARVKAADARAEGALANYQEVVLRALEETDNALVRFAKERERRDYLRDAAKESNKAAELARVQYQAGLTDFLSVLDAQREVLVAETELSRSNTALITSLVNLFKALGGGWEHFALANDTHQLKTHSTAPVP